MIFNDNIFRQIVKYSNTDNRVKMIFVNNNLYKIAGDILVKDSYYSII